MKLVVDANIFLSIAFSKTGFVEDMFLNLFKRLYEYYSPFYVYKEILEWVMKITEKRWFDYFLYKEKVESLLEFVNVVNYDFYKDVVDIVKQEVNLIDPKDIDYVALAYKLRSPLWTNDKKLKKLKCIEVFSTEELMQKFEDF